MEQRLRFDVAYDGTDFNGWQVQPGLPTIQGTLEEVIGSIQGTSVHVAGSGRTDAGVHALAQVAAVSITNPIPPDNFRRAVNRLLPRSIRILNVQRVAAEFHPRFDALRKTYEYRIFRDEVCPPFARNYVYHHPYPLHEASMLQMATLLEGEHDFSAFAATDERDKLGASKVRRVYHSGFQRSGDHLIYTVTGSGFLKHMVRNVVGTLIQAGRGILDRDALLACLQPGCTRPAGPTVPASGLFLVSVEYPEPPPSLSDG